MNIFYEPQIQKTLLLNEEESRHAVKVLRLNTGDKIHVVDGMGGLFTCEITKPHDKKCEVRIEESVLEFEKRSYYIHLIIAPTKNLDRMEWMVEKCVEMGIDELSFIQTRYSERKELKTQRIEKIAVGAMKQSLKAFLPKINEMISWKEFLKKDISTGQLFIAHLEEGERTLLQKAVEPNGIYRILIGPEGDFTPDEIAQAFEKGFKPVSLGNSRLRTETAGLAACHTFNLLNES